METNSMKKLSVSTSNFPSGFVAVKRFTISGVQQQQQRQCDDFRTSESSSIGKFSNKRFCPTLSGGNSVKLNNRQENYADTFPSYNTKDFNSNNIITNFLCNSKTVSIV